MGSLAAAARRDIVGSESRKKTYSPAAAAAAARMGLGRPSVEALAMAGCNYEHWSPEEETTAPPEHLHAIDLKAIDAFLEEAVPEDMVAAAGREEEARLRRGGRPRSREDGVKEMLRLWAKAVVKKAVGSVVINQQ